MPQIYDMGPTALLPLRRAEDLKIRRQTWVLKASTLPLDHQSRDFRYEFFSAVCHRSTSLSTKSSLFFSSTQISTLLYSISTCCEVSGFNYTRGVTVHMKINLLNPELNPICHSLALIGAYHILHISRIRVKAE